MIINKWTFSLLAFYAQMEQYINKVAEPVEQCSLFITSFTFSCGTFMSEPEI